MFGRDAPTFGANWVITHNPKIGAVKFAAATGSVLKKPSDGVQNIVVLEIPLTPSKEPKKAPFSLVVL